MLLRKSFRRIFAKRKINTGNIIIKYTWSQWSSVFLLFYILPFFNMFTINIRYNSNIHKIIVKKKCNDI